MARHRALEMFGRSGNPAFRSKAFTHRSSDFSTNEVMTLSGAVNKTGLYLLLCVLSAAFNWNLLYSNPSLANGLLWFGVFGGLVAAIVTIWKPTTANISAPIYAVLQGLALGAVSGMYEYLYDGIVMQALALTFGTLAALLLAYKSGLIKPTENFRLMLFAATGGVFILYLVNVIMSFFGGPHWVYSLKPV
jgi:Predicted membrane protein